MINDENLKKIYESGQNNQELTTKTLNGYGFNSKDLAKLIENGTLERIKRGLYSLKNSLIQKDDNSSKSVTDKKDNSEYIQGFYKALDQNDFDKARTYLDKISKSNNLGQIEELKQVLKNTEMMLYNKRNNQTSSTGPKDSTQSKKKTYDIKEFINQKLEELYEKGMVLLNPMDNERIKEIEEIVENIPDVRSFSIGSGSSRQIVLRFKPDLPEPLDIKKLFAVGNEAYKNRDYDTCIESYKQLLKIGHPKSFIYGKIGFAYMKKHNIKEAIDYLTVSTELNKNEDGKYDYTELINKLDGSTAEEDQKTYVRMSTTDFENDLDDYYGIEQVEQIAELITSGVHFDDACLNIGLDEEQKSTIALIYAREFYAEENYKMGDQYLKKVERTKNKSKFIKSLIKELRKNKKFYKNRAEKRQKKLVLTSRTKKQ